MNAKEERKQQLFEMNNKIAVALGYHITGYDDEFGGVCGITTPDNIDLEFTTVDAAEYDDMDFEAAKENAWEIFLDPDQRQYLDEQELEDVPPLWSEDATAAMKLFEDMDKPEEFWLNIEYVYVQTTSEWRYHCNIYLADWLTGCRGIDGIMATAICEAWLAYRAMQPVKPNN